MTNNDETAGDGQREMALRCAFSGLKGYLEILQTDKAALSVNSAYLDRLHKHYMVLLENAIFTKQTSEVGFSQISGPTSCCPHCGHSLNLLPAPTTETAPEGEK